MATKHIGKLKPRYSLLLNPYSDVRLSKCPRCNRLTHPRKFALFIHVKDWGPLVLGKTCRYCTPCELIIVHRDELEAELARSPAQVPPDASGRGYFIAGTVERKEWQKGLTGDGPGLGEMLEHMSDFKKYYDLHYQPAGWYPAETT
jgi:hypothetical protein